MSDTSPDATGNTYRPMPLWLSVLIILVSLGGGAVYARWYLQQQVEPERVTVTVADAPEQQQPDRRERDRSRFSGGASAGDWSDGVRDVNNTTFIRSGDLQMMIFRRNDEVQTRFHFFRNDPVPADQQAIVNNHRRLSRDAQLRQRLNLTSEQEQKLGEISMDRPTGLSDSDRARLNELAAVYVNSTSDARSSAGAALQQALGELKDRLRATTQEAYAQRVATITAALKPEQVEALKSRE